MHGMENMKLIWYFVLVHNFEKRTDTRTQGAKRFVSVSDLRLSQG
jgi:hypothetical protein